MGSVSRGIRCLPFVGRMGLWVLLHVGGGAVLFEGEGEGRQYLWSCSSIPQGLEIWAGGGPPRLAW